MTDEKAREDFMNDVYNTLDFLPTNNEANRIIDSFDRVTSELEQQPCEDWYDVPSNEMTLEQARQAVKDLRKKLAEYLEQKPCEDAVSRQAAKKALEDRFMELQKRHDDKRYETNYCLNTILELPSVTPKEKSESEHDHEVVKAYNDGQAYILDKIKAEIENDFQFKQFPRSPWSCGLRRALEIIDKYRESEDKE